MSLCIPLLLLVLLAAAVRGDMDDSLESILEHFSVTHKPGEDMWRIDASVKDSSSEKVPSIFVSRAKTPRQIHPNHTCYNINFEDNSTFMCYPLVTIGGVAKCGTSSLYSMFSLNKKVHVPRRKEECNRLYFRLRNDILSRRSDMNYLWHYLYWLGAHTFEALLKRSKFAISGCIQSEIFQLMSYLLRGPKTSIILSTRDFADRAYSVYKYFCSLNIDKNCLDGHVDDGVNVRNPEDFHNMIVTLKNSSNPKIARVPVHHIVSSEWSMLSNFYRDRPKRYAVSREGEESPDILMVAMENIDRNPKKFWYRIVYSFLNLDRGPFYRFKRKASKSHVNPALINISFVLDKTRAIIDEAWHADCLWTSRATRYWYPACHPKRREKLRLRQQTTSK